MKTTLLACSIGLLGLSAMTAPQAGPIVNPSFDGDFDGWSGETDDDTNGVLDVDPDASPRFSILGSGLAELTTDPNDPNGDNTFGVYLFQDFDLPTNATTISIDYSWDLTTATGLSADFAQIILFNTDNTSDEALLLDATSLTGSGTLLTDISSFAGKNVELLFTLEDGGDDNADRFSFGNIVIGESAATVPTPAPLALIGIGVMALARRRARGPAS